MKKVYSVDQLPEIVSDIRALMQEYRIFALTGSLGAGKTTLVRALLQACGVQGVISSPTFNYVNIYTDKNNKKIYHFDLYRLASAQEFIDAGFDEYLNDQDAYVFIEWPEVIQSLLAQQKVCNIALDYVSEGLRSISV